MSTKIYGHSDDLVEFEGDVAGEVSFYGTNGRKMGILLCLSDGTYLEAKYGKDDEAAVWQIRLVKQGSLFDHIEPCFEETKKGYSDIAHFKDGLVWAFAATEWELVK